MKELYKQNEDVLHKLSEGKPWYETSAPLFYTLLGALVTLFIQWRSFKWNERKETRKEIGRLFAEFSYNCTEYAYYAIIASDRHIKAAILEKKCDFYKGYPDMKDVNLSLEYEAYYKDYKAQLAKLYPEDDELTANYKDFRFKTQRPLYELQLIFDREDFNKLCKEFSLIAPFIYDRKEVVDIRELHNGNYFKKLQTESEKYTSLIDELGDKVKAEISRLVAQKSF